MHSTVFNVNKKLSIENFKCNYLSEGDIPIEYHELLIPAAGALFRQDDSCDILSQHLVLPPFSIWLHDILAKDHLLIRTMTPVALYTLHFMFEDSLPIPRAGIILDERECNCFYLSPGNLYRIPMRSDKKVFSFHINVNPVDMAVLAQQHPILQCLTEGIHPNTNKHINTHPYHINAVCDHLIRKLMTCRYTGPNAITYLRRCVTDILLNFATQHTDSQEPFLYSSMENAATLNNIFSFLAEHPHKIGSVAELAYLYNIPQQELEHGFRQHFAISIADYMHMLKMMVTWHLVQTDAFPLNEVGNVTGYPDAAFMISELKAYYGSIPHME